MGTQLAVPAGGMGAEVDGGRPVRVVLHALVVGGTAQSVLIAQEDVRLPVIDGRRPVARDRRVGRDGQGVGTPAVEGPAGGVVDGHEVELASAEVLGGREAAIWVDTVGTVVLPCVWRL